MRVVGRKPDEELNLVKSLNSETVFSLKLQDFRMDKMLAKQARHWFSVPVTQEFSQARVSFWFKRIL